MQKALRRLACGLGHRLRSIGRGKDPDILFLGDSITEWWQWSDPRLFRFRPNRGVGGENTSGILARFECDVLDARPRYVHIMAGTNDLWHTNAPEAPAGAVRNISAMLDLAAAHEIECILAAVPPANPKLLAPNDEWVGLIPVLNNRLEDLAGARHALFIDYGRVLGPSGEMAPACSDDGVHPNAAGYAAMSSLVKPLLSRLGL